MADGKLGPYNTDASVGYRVYPGLVYILMWVIRSQSSHFRDTTLELSLNGGHSLLASPCSIGAQEAPLVQPVCGPKNIRFLSKTTNYCSFLYI